MPDLGIQIVDDLVTALGKLATKVDNVIQKSVATNFHVKQINATEETMDKLFSIEYRKYKQK